MNHLNSVNNILKLTLTEQKSVMAKSSTNRLTAIGEQVQAASGSRMKKSEYDSIQRDSNQATYAMHLRQLLKSGSLTLYGR